jgi:hypothetical protein
MQGDPHDLVGPGEAVIFAELPVGDVRATLSVGTVF